MKGVYLVTVGLVVGVLIALGHSSGPCRGD
jgi:hypothetical protein